MKLLKFIAIPVSTLVLLSSCAMPNLTAATGTHCIMTKDGREVMCDGEPVLQEKTGYYRYRTFQKRDGVIRRDDVASIQKRNA